MTTQHKWTTYQTECLFALVGTNPLPNYVAAYLLARPNGTVYLLHSGTRGTARVADLLTDSIRASRPDLKVVMQELDEVRADRITIKVTEILRPIGPKTRVGLNYTGGTKAMAVHAYRTIAERCLDAVFSYLDARTLSFFIEIGGGTATKEIRVGTDCQIQLQDLLRLHGRPIEQPKREPQLLEIFQSLAEVHAKENGAGRWRQWCSDNLRQADKPTRFRDKAELKMVNLPTDPELAVVFATVPNAHKLADLGLLSGWKVDKLAKWLDGGWLEHYVLDCVRQVAGKCQIHDLAMNLEPKSGGQSFEFDVAAMRGYQLFAISCTTETNKGMGKLKLFEAHTRARQMGGDEAHTALVCCTDDPISLQHEVDETWFTEGKVRVFGFKHLLKLNAHLQDWFEASAQAD